MEEDRSTRHRYIAFFVIIVVAAIIVSTMLYVLHLELPEDTTPPSKVEGLEVYDMHDGKLFLFWDEATDNRKVDRYQVFRDGNMLPTEPSYPFFVDASLVNWVSYVYQVRAVDSSGNEGEKSNSAWGTPTPSDNVPPGRVDGLEVMNVHNGKLNLTWNPAFDNVGISHYNVYRDGVRLDQEPVNTYFVDSGLTNYRNYTYEVSAVDTSGNEGQRSVPATGTPTEYDSEPPSKVTGLMVTDEKDGKLNLTWSPATDNIGVVKYHIYRDGLKLLDEPATTWFLDTGLSNGQEYTYTVSAVDAQGNEGPESNPASGTPTSSVPEVSISGVPQGPGTYSITVFFVSEAVDFGLYGASLLTDLNETDRMDPLADGATAGNITFYDMDSDGLFTVGDSFVINVTSGHDYQFSIIWRATQQTVETHLWTAP
ncbi:MAG: fibronectin type III domain-containing protein [Thermoplasmata archaeon]